MKTSYHNIRIQLAYLVWPKAEFRLCSCPQMGFTPQIYISGWAQVDVNGFNLGWILQKIPFCNPTHFPGSQPFSSTLSMSILLKLAVKWHISQCSSSKPRGSIPSAYTRAKETRANELMKVLTLFFFCLLSLLPAAQGSWENCKRPGWIVCVEGAR